MSLGAEGEGSGHPCCVNFGSGGRGSMEETLGMTPLLIVTLGSSCGLSSVGENESTARVIASSLTFALHGAKPDPILKVRAR